MLTALIILSFIQSGAALYGIWWLKGKIPQPIHPRATDYATDDEQFTIYDAAGNWLFVRYGDHPDMVDILAQPERYRVERNF